MKTKTTFLGFFLLVSGFMYAQAPGGVGDLTGTSILQLWLKADAGVFPGTDATPVDSITDFSGAHNTLTATGTVRPTLTNNSFTTHPGLVFTSGQYLSMTTPSASFNNTQATLFVVASTNIGGSMALMSVAVSGYTQEFLMYGKEPYHHTSLGSFVRRPHQCSGTYTGTFGVFCGVFGTKDTATYSYFNGLKSNVAFAQSGAPVDFINANRQIWLGQRPALNGAEYYAGTILEVIGYNTELSDAQRIAVENYIKNKYSLDNANCGVLEVPEVNSSDMESSVFPNPFHTSTVLNFPNMTSEEMALLQFSVYNTLGQKMNANIVFNGNSFTFARGGLANGLYSLQVKKGNNIIKTEKIILE